MTTDRDGAPLVSVDAEDACQRAESDRENLLEHLEEAMTLGHGFRFEPWRDRLPMEALLSIHDSHHQAEANHPEGSTPMSGTFRDPDLAARGIGGGGPMTTEPKFAYLVVMDRSGLHGIYYDHEQASHIAKVIEGVVCKVAITEDYRP